MCAPPFVYLSEVQGSLRKDYAVAAQNLWDKDPGAWTGEIPAQMLADMGIKRLRRLVDGGFWKGKG